jgi:trehalose 6-phosphate phosphatase
MPEYLFDVLTGVRKKITSADSVALFLDYDGTIADFAPRPTEAFPRKGVVDMLKSFLKNPRIHPFIITGRNEESIKQLLQVKGLKFISLHGFVMDFADFRPHISDEDKETIKRIFSSARKEFSGKDFDVFRKSDMGVGFNYRRYRGDEREVTERFAEIVKRHDTGKKFRIMSLSKAINVIPKEWDKGKAVDFVLERHVPRGSLPIYFGDDVTDEDAFSALKNRGITIYVKNGVERKTEAGFFVENPEEVLKALGQLFNGGTDNYKAWEKSGNTGK